MEQELSKETATFQTEDTKTMPGETLQGGPSNRSLQQEDTGTMLGETPQGGPSTRNLRPASRPEDRGKSP